MVFVVLAGTCSCLEGFGNKGYLKASVSLLFPEGGRVGPHHLLVTTSFGHVEDLVEANGSVSGVPLHVQGGHRGVGHPQVLHSSQRP